MTFLTLLFAHLLADYPLQGDFLAKMKGQRLLLMLTHCGIWTGCIAVAGHLCGLMVLPWMVAILFVGHFGIDDFKAGGHYGNADPLGWPLWVDQVAHIIQIGIFIWIR